MQNQQLLTFHEGTGTASILSKGATLTADLGRDQLFTKGGKKFAKIFLISAAENLKKWEVDAGSIPKRIGTFVGRPFISEPGLAHFDTDTLPVDQILKKQEQFRAGTIREVVTNSASGLSYAIVEFANTVLGNKVWNEMKQGQAIYSSPAVAGIAQMVGGVRHFIDWFGLHLARVKDPAYGVFHASIKETCEGDERACIGKMVASASAFMQDKTSSQILQKFKPCQMQQTANLPSEDCPPGPEGEDCRSKKVDALSASVASLSAKLEKALANIPGSEGKTTPVKDPIGGEKQTTTGQNGDDTCPDGEHMVAGNCVPNDAPPATANTDCPDSEKDADGNCPPSASTAAQVKDLQAVIAGYQNKEKEGLVSQVLEMKTAAELVDSAGIDAEREALSKLSIPDLQTKVADLTPVVEKVSEYQTLSGRMPNTDTRQVIMPAVASASGGKHLPSNLKEVGSWAK